MYRCPLQYGLVRPRSPSQLTVVSAATPVPSRTLSPLRPLLTLSLRVRGGPRHRNTRRRALLSLQSHRKPLPVIPLLPPLLLPRLSHKPPMRRLLRRRRDLLRLRRDRRDLLRLRRELLRLGGLLERLLGLLRVMPRLLAPRLHRLLRWWDLLPRLLRPRRLLRLLRELLRLRGLLRLLERLLRLLERLLGGLGSGGFGLGFLGG